MVKRGFMTKPVWVWYYLAVRYLMINRQTPITFGYANRIWRIINGHDRHQKTCNDALLI